MASNFKHEALKKCVAVICQSIGFQGIYSMPLEVLTDLLHRYLREIAVLTHRFSEHDNRSLPTLSDLSYAFHELKISMPELEEFINSVESSPFPDALPKLPVTRPSELNLLKPGSREILSRPIHIHEHLPPMLPDKEEDDSKDGLPNGICNGGGDSSSEGGRELEPGSGGSSPALSSFKRGADGVGGSSPKRMRLEGEGSPVREIQSIMMTTSGFISAAREGKLPDSRLPHIPMPMLPNQTPQPRSSGGGGGRSGSTSNNNLSAAAISAKKKLSLERLMRHKHNMAIKKAAQNAMSGLAAGSSSFNINKNKAAKKSLSHNAVLNMAGVGMDSSMCFTTKHGKSKEKLKPKIPPTPPGTSRVPIPVLHSSESPRMFNKNINIPKRPNPSMSSTPLPPKLKIPTPKLKQPEFSTDVLPLPKEDVQEQQERKLQIIKKEEKQKELARAAKNGLLGPLVASSAADADDARYVSGGVPTHAAAAAGGAGGPLAPVELINKIRKEKKEKDGKKEFKKGSKEVKKDKEKRDKVKHDAKKEKILKKKEGKEKREKERKEEKKKDKESKKLKDSSKKDKDLKKNKEKKLKDGKIKEKDHLKKEKKEKKLKKVGPSDGSPLKFSKETKLNSSIESNLLRGDTSLISTPPIMPDHTNFSAISADFNSSLSSPISPDGAKSKLCVFKKGTKTAKDSPLSSHDAVVDISDSHEHKPSLPGMGHNITNIDMSAELSGVLSSPSFIEDSHLNLPVKVGKTKKRKYTSEQLDSSVTGTPFSPKVKPKHEKLGSSPKGRSPKGSLVVSQSLGSTNDPIDLGDDNATPFSIGMMPGMPINSWDGRPLTPGSQINFGGNKGPLTPGLHSIPPFAQHPHSFLPPNIGMDPFSSPQRSHEPLDRPATPGQYFSPSVRTPDQYSSTPGSAPGTPPLLGGYTGSTSASGVLGKLPTDFSKSSSEGGITTVVPDGQRTPVDLDKKKKEKDHRKEKKDKDKIKKKKDKKEKLKLDKKVKDKGKKEKKKKKILNIPVSAAPGVSDQQKPNVHEGGPSDEAFGEVDLQGPFSPPATTKITGASRGSGRRVSTRVKTVCYKYK